MRRSDSSRSLSLAAVAVCAFLFLPSAASHPAETAAGDSGTKAGTPATEASPPFLRGMTVSCPIYGRIWGSPAMTETLRTLRLLGVDTVSIHPYARILRDGSVRFRPARETGYLGRAVEIARSEKTHLFWKPHLAYWGSFSWRGEIEFENEKAWRRFFDGYRFFIIDQARFAESHGVDLFAVGVETERTTRHEDEWRRIIREVRQVYSGRLTYAANWNTVDQVPFWDALDLVGVQAYFPVSHGGETDQATLESGWTKILAELKGHSKRFEKKILITEIGYPRSADAAQRPWEYRRDDSPANRELRQRLIATALQRLEQAPFVAGMYWWKWVPNAGSNDRDFAMQNPEAMEAIKRHWG